MTDCMRTTDGPRCCCEVRVLSVLSKAALSITSIVPRLRGKGSAPYKCAIKTCAAECILHADFPCIPHEHRLAYIISPQKFVIVVFIIVNSVLTVHIIWRNG